MDLDLAEHGKRDESDDTQACANNEGPVPAPFHLLVSTSSFRDLHRLSCEQDGILRGSQRLSE